MTSQTKPASPALEIIEAEFAAGTVLHLWLKARSAGREAKLFVSVERNDIADPFTCRAEEFEFFAVTLGTGGHTVLAYDAETTALSVVYAFHPQTVLEEGIHVLHHDMRTAPPRCRPATTSGRPSAG